MPRADETNPRNVGQMAAALREGLEQLAQFAEVEFQAYTRVVLPIDGYVFWRPTVPFKTKGSLHFSQEIQQNVDETVGFATVLFTSEREIVEFTSMPTNTIYVAKVGNFRYAFSQQQGFYKSADLWHYFGHSIYPALSTQLLDDPTRIDPSRAITSNSMALWLALRDYQARFPDWFSNTLDLFPSKLVDANLVPPYAAVHIDPSGTRALQPIPYLSPDRSSYQLASDRVQITLYGLQSDEAHDFVNFVLQYSQNTDNFGIMNMPIIQDGKREQVELEAIAMQKVVEFEISYYQTRVAAVARQMILKVITEVDVSFNFTNTV